MELAVSHSSFLRFYMARALCIPLTDIRFCALLTAIFVYGCFGSPTPDVMGWPEIVVGSLLAVAIPWFELFKNFCGQKILTAVLFALGLGGAVVLGAHETLILRDGVAFAFLFLPLILLPVFESRPQRIFPFLLAFMFCGGVFAFRSMSMMGDLNFWLGAGDALYYLANSPAVLFTTIFSGLLLCRGGMDWRKVSLPKFLVLFLICVITLAAMAATLQRASLGLFGLSIITYLAMELRNRPYKAIPVIALFASFMALILYSFPIIVDALSFKSRVVGDNMRFAEWQAVWESVSGNPYTILFGLGFGGTFESPAVGGMNVNYTHGLLGSVLLKTGMAGLLLIGIYLWMLIQKLASIIRHNLIIGLALVAPFIIDVFLYASFKSFEFGLLLTAIMAISLRFKGMRSLESLIFRTKWS